MGVGVVRQVPGRVAWNSRDLEGDSSGFDVSPPVRSVASPS